MTALLGAGFRPIDRSTLYPEPLPPPDRTDEVLAALASLRVALGALPQPVVHVDPPDLSAIVTAVSGLKPGAEADDIARAITARLTPPPPMPAAEPLQPTLDAIAKALTDLDFRLQGPTAMIGGGILHLDPAQLDSAGNVKVAGKVTGQTMSALLDYDASNRVTYIGKAPPGTAQSAATWTIAQFLYTNPRTSPDSILYATGAWSSRLSLTYS